MNPLVAEYRSLPRGSNSLADQSLNNRKVEIIKALDDDANEEDVSRLLFDLLHDRAGFGQARAEAIEVVGLYVDESSPLWRELFQEVLRIHADATEDHALKDWTERYVTWMGESLGTA